MEVRKRFIVIGSVIVGLCLAFLLVYVVFLRDEESEIVEESVPEEVILEDIIELPPDTVTFPLPPEHNEQQAQVEPTLEAQRSFVKNLARTFTERFGTYSSQNNHSNIDDSLALASVRMKKWIESKRGVQSNVYRGVSLTVVEVEVTLFGGGTAEVSLGAQEEIQTNTGIETNFKRGRVELVQEGGEWKVDALYWD